MKKHQPDAEAVAGELYDVLSGYDVTAFPKKSTAKGKAARASWVQDITDSYTQTEAG